MIKKTHILYALFTELITPRYITCAVFNHNIILLFFTFTTIRVSHNTTVPSKKLLPVQIYRDKIKLSFDKQS